MKKTFLVLAIFATSVFAHAQVSDLTKLLTSEMGITQKQAEGGAGALFAMAKESLPKADFSSLTKIIPNMSSLLKAVPSLGGGTSSMLGSAATALTGMPAVVAAFEKLGLKQSQVALMTPLISNYIEDKGGKALSSLFSNAVSK